MSDGENITAPNGALNFYQRVFYNHLAPNKASMCLIIA
jgi:hypothetical protein